MRCCNRCEFFETDVMESVSMCELTLRRVRYNDDCALTDETRYDVLAYRLADRLQRCDGSVIEDVLGALRDEIEDITDAEHETHIRFLFETYGDSAVDMVYDAEAAAEQPTAVDAAITAVQDAIGGRDDENPGLVEALRRLEAERGRQDVR